MHVGQGLGDAVHGNAPGGRVGANLGNAQRQDDFLAPRIEHDAVLAPDEILQACAPVEWRGRVLRAAAQLPRQGLAQIQPHAQLDASCEDSIGCMHGSSEPDLRNWKSPPPQFTQGARP
ncbi:hypothetical protein, partial [Bordetella pertussis]